MGRKNRGKKMGENRSPLILSADDFYFSILSEDDVDVFPISDQRYAEELQLQEALMSSVVTCRTNMLPAENQGNPTKDRKHVETVTVVMGESSQRFCEICMEGKLSQEIFRNECSHSFCSECIRKHVMAKINDNINSITCPGLNCKRAIEPHILRPIIPEQVYDRWADALLESVVLASQKFYCPYGDCSAMLVDDGVELVRESECPYCRRLFCGQCKVPWHSNILCEDFQRLNENERGRDDIMVMELAKKNKWKRCPNCKFYVEKKDGCLHINCRCGFQFCYGCGAPMDSNSCMFPGNLKGVWSKHGYCAFPMV